MYITGEHKMKNTNNIKAKELKKDNYIVINNLKWRVVWVSASEIILQRRCITKAFNSNGFMKIIEKTITPEMEVTLL